MLGVGRRRRRHELAAQPRREAHPIAVDVGAGIGEAGHRARVVANLDADLLQDDLGIALQQLETLLGDELDRL